MFTKRLSILLAIVLIISCFATPVAANRGNPEAPPVNPFEAFDRARADRLVRALQATSAIAQDEGEDPVPAKRRQAGDRPADVGDKHIVQFEPLASLAQIHEALSPYEYRPLGKSELRLFVVRGANIKELEQRAAGLIASVEKDEKISAGAVPSDTYYAYQWALPAVRAPQAWDLTTGSNTVCVAVIDTGVYRAQPDLANCLIYDGVDYIWGGTCDFDAYGHGTSVTGVIGAQTNNSRGIAGVSWSVAILPMLVLGADGTGDSSDITAAIYDAADAGCDIINLSLGGPTYLSSQNSAIDYAVSKGCIVVAAAGNKGDSTYSYPASYNNVISVSSVDSTLTYSSFSQYNDKVDVAAPGRDILSTTDWYYAGGNNYGYVTGTSFAAPIVSGIAALLCALDPSVTPAEFTQILQWSCTDLGPTGYDVFYGHGLVNAERVVMSYGLPAVPRDFRVEAAANKYIRVVWTANLEGDLNGYQLQYKQATASDWTILDVERDMTGVDLGGLVNGVAYEFRLKAKDLDNNWSAFTDVVTGTPVDDAVPEIPTGLHVLSVNDGQVTLGWTAVSATDLAGYQLEHKPVSGSVWTETAVGKVTSYTITGLTNGQEYSFRIRSKDTPGNLSAVSAEITGTPVDRSPPAAPTGLSATAGINRDITLTWNANAEPDLGGYEIAYQKSGTTTWVTQAAAAGESSATVEDLVHNVKYTLKLRARDLLDNWSAYSLTAVATPKDLTGPAAPTGLAAEPRDKAAVVTWAANGETDLGGYQLERKAATATTWTLAAVSKTTTTYTMTGLVNGTTYQLRLKAKDLVGNWSAYSEVVTCVPVDNVAPPVPAGLRVVSTNDRQAALGWTAVSATDLAGYQLEHKAASESVWTETTIGKVTSYTLTGLTNGEEHSFRIKSRDTSGNLSAASAVVVGTPVDKMGPAAPTGQAAVPGINRDVTLTWNANSEPDLAGYEIGYLKYGTSAWITQAVGAEATTAIVEGLVHNVSYTFRVRARDLLNNWSAYSLTVKATPKDLVAPATPLGFAAEPRDKAAILTWTANGESDLGGYQLECKTLTATTWTLATVSATATTYTKTSLVNGTIYQFRIKAKDLAGNWSAHSEIVTCVPYDNVAPPVPSGLRVTSVNDRRVALSWSSVSATDLAGYQLEHKAVSESEWTESAVGKVTSYTINGLTNGEEHSFRIRSRDTSGNLSAASATVLGTPVDRTGPAVPTGLLAVPGIDRDVDLTWNANADPDLGGYEVAHQKYRTTTWTTTLFGAEATSATIEGLVSSVSYTFKIRAHDALGNWSAYSPTVRATPEDLTLPAAPVDFAAEPRDKAAILAWTANGEADLGGYQLENKTLTGSTWTLATVPATATTYTKTSLVNGTTYQFRLKAKDLAGNWSPYSEIVTCVPYDNVAPPVPSGLRVTSVNDRQVALGWSSVSATDLVGYQLEHKAASQSEWTETTVGKVTRYTITGLTNGEEHSFRIRSRDTSGNLSAASAVVSGTPVDRMGPAAPTGLLAVPGIDRDVDLTWDANADPDLDGYEVAYQKYRTTTWMTALFGAEATSATIEGLVSNVSYTFKIRAQDELGNWSAYSATVKATPGDLTAPAAPTSLTTEPRDRAVALTWAANNETDLGGYLLEYKVATASTWNTVSLSATLTAYTKTSLANGATYQFRLKAKDKAGNWSGYSETVSATPSP